VRRLLNALGDSGFMFSFLSGALISLSGNFVTAALIWTKDLPISRARLNWLGFFVAISSVGCFWSSTTVERARRAWEADGAPAGGLPDYVKRHGLRGLIRGLSLLLLGLVLLLATILKSY
jgi:hypothetical protein